MSIICTKNPEILLQKSEIMAKTPFFGIFIYKQEFGTVEPKMLKEASKRMPTGKNSHIHKVFTNFGVDIS